MSFDIWGDDNGSIKALPASKVFVDNQDAPYGFSCHLLRVDASSKREAIKEFRKLNNEE